MALKAQWERFFEKESLTAFPDEAKQLSLEFNPGYGRCADADALYDLFEDHNHYASEAGYDRDKFKTLIHQTIMAHGHLFGIRSLELDAFVAERRKEQALVKDASQSEQEEFWRAKLMWLEQRRILEQWLLELENQRLKNANVQQKQALVEHFNAARQINREEIGLDRRALDKLYDILAQVEALWESMGVDIDTRLVIRGETLLAQMAWLETESTRLEGEVEEVRNELTVLSEDQDIQEKLYSLASENAIAQMKEDMKAKLTTSQAQISERKAELAALFRYSFSDK